MADSKKILIIEDDPDISMIEEAYLQASGFETKVLEDGMNAVQIAESEHFDLILLDLMLPGKSGYQVCRELRDKIDIPILMVTARTESVDKVRGLGLGADDYISKPFDPAELVARVNANLRQYERMAEKFAKKEPDASEEICIQDLRIQVNSWKVFKGDQEIRFPNREFELLKFLAMNPNIVFSKDKLFEKIWGYDYVGDSATVMVHVNRIREKIEDDPKNPKILETVWGAGYRLNKNIRGEMGKMWVLFAVGSSFFAGITAILAKCGIRKTDSDVATAIRTVVVLLFSWLMVLVTGTWSGITEVDGKTLLFLVLSGLATGASWLCYFHALQKGDINKVVPIDKSSTILTILLALIFLHEGLTPVKGVCVVLIGAGTMLMITRKEDAGDAKKDNGKEWLVYAVLSAVFASLTAILGKIGISGIDSNLGTAIRTTVVIVMAWLMVFLKGKQKELHGIEKKELVFIALSGLATGASWLCYYRALQDGPASVVVPIDKLSILVTIAFSWVVFKEKLTKKAALGLLCILAGTIMMAVL